MKRKHESILYRFRLVVVLVTVLSAPLFADTGESNRAVVLLRPDEMSFWRTATNSVIALPVDMPPLASSAVLNVRGVDYQHDYEIGSSGQFEVSLPPLKSAANENVYELTLTFDDGTVRTAKLGLVQGYAKGGDASTRVVGPVGSQIWCGVKKCAVMPIPYGMESFTVNGVETDTGLGGAQGWYALKMDVDQRASVGLVSDGLAFAAELLGLGDGFFFLIR